MKSAQQLAVGAFSFDTVLSFGQAITDTSGKFEKYNAILKTGLQSRAGASDNLNLLTDFAADTPNSLEELTGSFIKFVNRGLIPTRQQLTNFGDLAASQGKGFDQLTEAVLDAQTGEFERLKEFGVTAHKSGDQVTLSFKGVTQTVKNTGDEITKAILKFGQMNGVAGSMAAVSQTLEGKLSNLGDMFDRLLVGLGEGGVSGGFKEAIDLGSKFLGVVTDLIAKSPVEELRSQQTELNGLVGAIALANDNESVRLNLITQLNQKYPEFLGQLNAESINTDLLTTRLAAANDQYERKIRIALGQQAIKKSTEELTASIDQQSNALQQLSRASGKTLTDLERLSSAQRIDLARKLAAQQPQVNLGMGVYGPNPLSAIATVLEEANKRQKVAQAELNKLTAENATRQADLTKTTVDGYQAQIAQIREKIKLHQIDAKLGEAEIKRLKDLSLIAQGKTPAVAPIKPATVTRSGNAALLDTGNLAVFKRYADQLKREIEEIGENSPQLAEKQQALASINDQIARLNFLTSGNQRVSLPGLAEITSIGTDVKLKAALASIVAIKAVTPELFAKSGANDFLTDMQKAAPSLEYIRAKIDEVRATIATLGLNNIKVPPELLEQLRTLKQLLQNATSSVNTADATTESGEGNDSKWVEKAQKRIDAMKAAGKEVKFTAEELGKQMKEAAMGFANASFSALESIGAALGKGDDPLKAALQSLTETLGNYLIKQGEALALAALFEQTAAIAAGPLAPLLELPVGFQLAAAGALIVGGAAVKNIGKFAKGGVFTQPSIGLFGEYPGANMPGRAEIATPQNLMRDTFQGVLNQNSAFNLLRDGYAARRNTTPQRIHLTGEFTARGSDMKLILNRYENIYPDYN